MVISLYLECACDWQVHLLCSLSEMSVPGGVSYMHFTPFCYFKKITFFYICLLMLGSMLR